MRKATLWDIRSYQATQLVPLAVLPDDIARSVRRARPLRIDSIAEETIPRVELVAWSHGLETPRANEVIRALAPLESRTP
jgi:hypothetical protein